jgi:hypothetical protein
MTGSWHQKLAPASAFACALLLSGSSAFAYSVLTHEEIVDLAWKSEIRPGFPSFRYSVAKGWESTNLFRPFTCS